MKRAILTIIQYDYRSEKEYLKDLPKMIEKGWIPLNENSALEQNFTFGQVADDIFTVAYMKDMLYKTYNK